MVTQLENIIHALCVGNDSMSSCCGTCGVKVAQAKEALAALKNPSNKALLAPGEPYQVAAKVLVSRERGIELRRQAWNKIIDAILKGD